MKKDNEAQGSARDKNKEGIAALENLLGKLDKLEADLRDESFDEGDDIDLDRVVREVKRKSKGK